MSKDISLHSMYGCNTGRNSMFYADNVLIGCQAGVVTFEEPRMPNKTLSSLTLNKGMSFGLNKSMSSSNLSSGNSKKDFLRSEASIACITVDSNGRYLAAGERGFQPNLNIYSLKDRILLKKLSGGTEKAYACLDFNKNGEQLVSLGAAPDYLLTVWNWQEGAILLRSKAFSQDVYLVKFSLYDDRKLTTCGTGHIRFWSITSTFTGLKLQGKIGKFGKVELSDIAVFVELPDGKVLSGTETGHLLLWEGNFIKCRFLTSSKPCHQGEVTYLKYDESESHIISAGKDGYLRWWDFETIDSAEVDSDHSIDFVLTCKAECQIEKDIGIQNILYNFKVDAATASTIVTTTSGSTLLVKLPVKITNGLSILPNINTLSNNHAGQINSIASGLNSQIAVTAGKDKTLRCWDYDSKTLLGIRSFTNSVTCVKFLPAVFDPKVETILVGFDNGVVRQFTIVVDDVGKITFKRKSVFKPHKSAVLALMFNSIGTLATSGEDSIVFLFDYIVNTWIPKCFIELPGGLFCSNLTWNADNSKLVCFCSDGSVKTIFLSSKLSEDNENVEFVLTLNDMEINMGIHNYSKISYNHGVYLDQTKILTSGRTNNESILIDFSILNGNGLLGNTYSIGTYDINAKLAAKTPLVTCIKASNSKNLILVGLEDGSIIIRSISNPMVFIKYCGHNGSVIDITTSFDDKYILSVGVDGVLLAYELIWDLKEKNILPPSTSATSNFMSLNQDKNKFEKINDLSDLADVCEDLPDNAYSIQDSKLKKERDEKVREAEKRKEKILASISSLRKEYLLLRTYNQTLPKCVRLNEEDLTIDHEYFSKMKTQKEIVADVVHQQCSYETEKSSRLKDKTIEKYMTQIMFTEIPLYGINNSSIIVKSLRARDIDNSIKKHSRSK